MRVSIIGSHEWPSSQAHLIQEYVDQLPPDTVVVVGDAVGVDQVAHEAAKARGLKVLRVEAKDRTPLGLRARTGQVAATGDRLVAFWNGVSPGTVHGLRVARRLGKPIEIHELKHVRHPALGDPKPIVAAR